MSELTPAYEEARFMMLSSYSKGGIGACVVALEDLTLEADCLRIFANEASRVVHETVDNQDSLTIDEQRLRLEFALGINNQRRETIERRRYAVPILGELINKVVG